MLYAGFKPTQKGLGVEGVFVKLGDKKTIALRRVIANFVWTN